MKTNQIALLVIAAIIVITCVGVYTMSDKSKDDSNNVNAVIDSDYYPVTVTTTNRRHRISANFHEKT